MEIFVMDVEIPFPSPRLNPQEFVNQDVKANFLSGVVGCDN
jgi:hypothetical protein